MIPALSWEEALLRLALAALFGGAIGIEREFREREAGLRTHMLVSVGSALFTIVSAYGFTSFIESGSSAVRADPTRIAAQIVTGIGFLGAGAIIRMGVSVRGLTTAASLWVVAAIGMAAGAGYWSASLITTPTTYRADGTNRSGSDQLPSAEHLQAQGMARSGSRRGPAGLPRQCRALPMGASRTPDASAPEWWHQRLAVRSLGRCAAIRC